ncbi:hypothetical protein QQG91_11460 [Marivivens sp. LCG002]|uniref:hypothetical protein n=1 Tax=Marivivens sp. LCG002 TaxID=3051171 RepID=UPI0025579792|nr:hypothetical protein [Marivivens sp. LCG002]WIV50281.1 hypothetical protein QQG91_11460 [Marivivens sp. LCG002]
MLDIVGGRVDRCGISYSDDCDTFLIGQNASKVRAPKGSKVRVYSLFNRESVKVPLWAHKIGFNTRGATLIFSLDTEYVRDGAKNDIVSYQVTAISSDGRFLELIFKVDKGVRLSLAQIIDTIAALLGLSVRSLQYNRKNDLGGVIMISHFGTAEWAALSDRFQLANYLKIVRKVPLSLGFFEYPLDIKRNERQISLRVFDTTTLAATGKGKLEYLGETVGISKVGLPEGAIREMRQLSIVDEDLFDLYGITDCRICLAYYQRMKEFAHDVLRLDTMPVTLGGFAVSGYRAFTDSKEFARVFSLVERRKYKKIDLEVSEERTLSEPLFAQSFAGGLNVAVPASFAGCLVLDIDFTSCYPSVAAALPILRFSEDLIENEKEDEIDASTFTAHVQQLQSQQKNSVVVSVARVAFKFPEDCKWPCIPVDAEEAGIIYPLEGVGYATTYELLAALKKNAEIRVLRHELILADTSMGDVELAFASYLKELVTKRRAEVKGSLQELTYKEMTNSFYGKLAQGIKPRNVRSFETSEELGQSAITFAPYASMITGTVRAALVELIDAIEESGGSVVAATTDGALAVFPNIRFERGRGIDDVPGLREAIDAKPAIGVIAAGLANMGCAPMPVEVKHVGDNVEVFKTRGYILRDGGKVEHCARAGMKLNPPEIQAYLADDDKMGKWELTRLCSAQSIYDRKYADLVEVKEDRSVNVDYDFKRIPCVDGSFRAPKDYDEFISYRKSAQNVRRDNKRASIARVRFGVSNVQQRGGVEAAAFRQFIRAIAHDLFGLYPRDDQGNLIPQALLAKRLEVKLDDIKNAKRSRFSPPPRSEMTQEILNKVLKAAHVGAMPDISEEAVGSLFSKN